METGWHGRKLQDNTDPGAAAITTVATIPHDEIWQLYTGRFTGSAGTITASNLWVLDPDVDLSVSVARPSAAQSQFYDFLNKVITIPPGWLLQVTIAAYNALDTYDFDALLFVRKLSSK